MGVLAALPIIFLLGKLIEAQLVGVRAPDPGPVVIAAVLLLSVCLAASVGPARRASSVSSTEAFRTD